jgi:hypothetical protein
MKRLNTAASSAEIALSEVNSALAARSTLK